MVKANYEMCKQCRIKHLGEDGWCELIEAWATKGKSRHFQHPHIYCPNNVIKPYYDNLLHRVREYITVEERRTFNVRSISTLNRFELDIDDVPCWCPNVGGSF